MDFVRSFLWSLSVSSSKLWFAKFEGLCSPKWLVHQWAEVWPVAASKKRRWLVQWWIRSEWDVAYEPFIVHIPSWYWLEELWNSREKSFIFDNQFYPRFQVGSAKNANHILWKLIKVLSIVWNYNFVIYFIYFTFPLIFSFLVIYVMWNIFICIFQDVYIAEAYKSVDPKMDVRVRKYRYSLRM
jgi:hypothetical protein